MATQNLTVLNISQNYHIHGGSDRIFFETAALLRSRGHTVIPFTATHPNNRETRWASYFPTAANFENPGLKDLARFIYSAPARDAIQQLIRDQRPDIAHLHIYYGKLTGSILAPLKNAGIPVVHTLHEYKLICPVYTLVSNGEICEACQGRHFWRAVSNKCNQRSVARSLLSATEMYVSRMLGSVDKIDQFVAVSDFVRDKVIEHGIPAHKVTTVYNFVDVSEVRVNTQPGDYLLYFGRLERLKGIFTLLDAVAPLQVPLVIAGDGNIREKVDQYITTRNLAHVRTVGFQASDQLDKLIANSLCTIVPSEWYEPLGMTILESFAHARPVIGSRIGGISEMITHRKNGLLVPPGDVDALREAIAWIANNPERACDMGRDGRRVVETRFSPETYYEGIMSVYDQLM